MTVVTEERPWALCVLMPKYSSHSHLQSVDLVGGEKRVEVFGKLSSRVCEKVGHLHLSADSLRFSFFLCLLGQPG